MADKDERFVTEGLDLKFTRVGSSHTEAVQLEEKRVADLKKKRKKKYDEQEDK